MSIKLRLSLLLSLLLLAFVISLLALRRFEAQQSREMTANTRLGRINLLDRWLDLTGQSLRRLADDYSQWEDMVRFVNHPDPQWVAANIDANLGNFDAQAVWILRPDGTVIHTFNSLHLTSLEHPPVSMTGLLHLAETTPFMHFFAIGPGGLYEMRVAPIQPPAGLDSMASPYGWFMVARLWDQRQIQTLERLTDSRVTLIDPAGPPEHLPDDGTNIHLIRPLMDLQGRTVRLLRIDHRSPELAQVLQTYSFEARLFGGFGLLVIFVLALGLQQWVLRPVGWISSSLSHASTEPLEPLLREGEKTELGRMALLIKSAFAQRRELEREVEERKLAEAALRKSEAAVRRAMDEQARLGRNLHDSVIQSLYATGMGLVSIRGQVRSNPAEAEQKLDQAREALNETIRDVRNFILGLEPEAVTQQLFAQAVERLVGFMRAMQPFDAVVEIDESSANALVLAQRAHALQIAREAVSNALRHGRATRIILSLRRRAERIEFAIDDNGIGFIPGHTPNRGHGLRNLAERARELDAELTVTSEPGKGTHVILAFPTHP